METRAKSDVVREISEAIDQQKDCSISCRLKNREKLIKISLMFEEEETFTDKNGVVWVRK